MTTPQHFRIAILGSGFSGLGMAAQLVRTGEDNFVVFEKADEIGGVWRDNTYPGAACDTQAHVYCYSFFPHLRVSKMFAAQDEMLGYQLQMKDAFGLDKHIKYNSEIVSARWLEEDARWLLTLRGGEQYTADFFIPAWGQLNAPKVPAWEGQDTFKGEQFHSAHWNHDIDLKGKKVISIGSAASAVQYVPFVAQDAEHLEVFQRSANYILPREQITFTEEQLDAFEQDPSIFEESRRSIHELREAGFERTRLNTDGQQQGAQESIDYLNSVITDPELREKLTPTYEFGCKRILRTSDYYPTFLRDNVSLVTEGIDRFTENGIVTADGVEHEADVIIYATGFYSQSFQGDLEIVGRDGVTLAQRWGTEDAEAFVGTSVDGFPNMFLIYGPNTNLNHNSNIAMFEIQQDHVIDMLRQTSELEGVSVEIRRDRLASFNEALQAEMEGSSFSSDCSSWYKNSKGKVINNWSGTVEEFRDWAAKFNTEDYIVKSTALVTA
ncbi:flavin-containing monooxygenase [Gulosibacter molinativorax]|uniref:NAD(P)/FAD-dependent oxidoreductase n=1 Tax=Gulosibacter molinativorax TaxID=256821 RepID=A0ABT7C6V0_9MICO|nr:NAD(P)/FAD-dependent oxidoreductase [Gulosibacter molinativorax]MDJ1370923.1 NAD(P)/FAD-dependent oxidoreductase [Gulosibacter molinativorax]QUY62712.1 Flavin-containing monooxygenase FMO [Gulosibacter molinativorax]